MKSQRTDEILRMTTTTLLSAQIKRAGAEDLRHAKYSVDEVAQALSALAGRDITAAQLEDFFAPTSPHRFPLDLVPAWVRITGSRRLLDAVMERL